MRYSSLAPTSLIYNTFFPSGVSCGLRARSVEEVAHAYEQLQEDMAGGIAAVEQRIDDLQRWANTRVFRLMAAVRPRKGAKTRPERGTLAESGRDFLTGAYSIKSRFQDLIRWGEQSGRETARPILAEMLAEVNAASHAEGIEIWKQGERMALALRMRENLR